MKVFVYKEEVDFSLRAKKEGYSSILFLNIKFHAGGGCSSKNKSKGYLLLEK